jgi:hypothetical protein
MLRVYGLEGTYTLELESSQGFAAALWVTDGLRNDRPLMLPEQP